MDFDLELGAEGAEGDVRNNAHRDGGIPHRHRGHYCVAGRVDHRDSARDIRIVIRDVSVFPVRVDGYPNWFPPTGMVATTVGGLVAMSITETVPGVLAAPAFAT